MDTILIGIVGSSLFVLAWAYEMWHELVKHKMYLDLKFAYLNLVGTFMIIIYSYAIHDPVFFWLNVITFAFIIFEICYSYYLKNKEKPRKKSKRI